MELTACNIFLNFNVSHEVFKRRRKIYLFCR